MNNLSCALRNFTRHLYTINMAYTDDAVLAKLSALNETQESIVSIYLHGYAVVLVLPSSNMDCSAGHRCTMGYVPSVRKHCATHTGAQQF